MLRTKVSNYPFGTDNPGPVRRRLGNSTRQGWGYKAKSLRASDDGKELLGKVGEKTQKSLQVPHNERDGWRRSHQKHGITRRAQSRARLNIVSPVRTSRASSTSDFDSAVAARDDVPDDFDSLTPTEGILSSWNGTDSSSHKQRCSRGAAGQAACSGTSSYSSMISTSSQMLAMHCKDSAECSDARDLFQRISWLLLDVAKFVDVTTLMSLCTLSRFHSGVISTSAEDSFRSIALADRETSLFSLSPPLLFVNLRQCVCAAISYSYVLLSRTSQ